MITARTLVIIAFAVALVAGAEEKPKEAVAEKPKEAVAAKLAKGAAEGNATDAAGTATAPEVHGDANATAGALSEGKLNKLAVPSLLQLHQTLNDTRLHFLADKFDACKNNEARILKDEDNEKCIKGFEKEDEELATIVRGVIKERNDRQKTLSAKAAEFFTTYRQINAEVRPIYREDKLKAVKTLIEKAVAKWDALPKEDQESFAKGYGDIAEALNDKETREFGKVAAH